MKDCTFRGSKFPFIHFCHPSQMVSTFKGKNLLLKEQILTFKCRPLFGKVLSPSLSPCFSQKKKTCQFSKNLPILLLISIPTYYMPIFGKKWHRDLLLWVRPKAFSCRHRRTFKCQRLMEGWVICNLLFFQLYFSHMEITEG